MNHGKQLIAALALALAAAAQAQQSCNSAVPATTPATDFSDAGNGTVLHAPTGLIWMRCAQGQQWSGGTCSGNPGSYTWQQALQAAKAANDGAGTAGKTDWRLPNVKELQSIVEQRCYYPAINTEIFPNAPASYFWSASAYAYSSDSAWYVYFYYGYAYGYGFKSYGFQVRLVRAGQ